MEKSVRLYSLDYNDVRTFLWAALFVVCNMALPQVAHLVPQGGIIFEPLSLVILVAACKLGWRTALLAAVVSPLVNNIVFGMPAWGVLPIMAVKLAVLALAAGLAVLALAAGLAVQRMQRVTLPMLCGAVLLSELVGGMDELVFTGGLHATIADFTIGWPGMLLQIAGSYLIVNFIWKR